MKKVLVFLSAITAFLAASCATTDDTVTPQASATVFQHATMKPWFDTYCASCHAAGKSDARDWLYNPANYESSIKGYIGKLYSEVYTRKTMPEGIRLSTSELQKFKDWYDAGYPAK